MPLSSRLCAVPGREVGLVPVVAAVLGLAGPFVLALGSAGLSVLAAGAGVSVSGTSPWSVSCVSVGGGGAWSAPSPAAGGTASITGSASSSSIGSTAAVTTPSGFMTSQSWRPGSAVGIRKEDTGNAVGG